MFIEYLHTVCYSRKQILALHKKIQKIFCLIYDLYKTPQFDPWQLGVWNMIFNNWIYNFLSVQTLLVAVLQQFLVV